MVTHEEAVLIDTKIYKAYEELFRVDAEVDSYLRPLYSVLRTSRRTYPLPEDIIERALEMEDSLSSRDNERVLRAIDKYNQGQHRVVEKMNIFQDLNSQYEGWSRFYIVSGGHIHNSMQCSTCNKMGIATKFGWLPELSGLEEKDAVEKYGAILCTVCYPSAPTEWTNGERKEDDDVCEGSGTYGWDGKPRTGYASGNGGTCKYCGQWVGVRSKFDAGIRKHKVKK